VVKVYRYRYAVYGLIGGVLYGALLFGLHYLISSDTPAQLLRDSPATVIMVSLTLPIFFLVGYLWGGQKDQRKSTEVLSARLKEHADMAEGISSLLKQREEARNMMGIAAREMKHPLTSIVGYSLTLQAYWDQLDEANRRECVRFIHLAASQLEAIANDMMRISEMVRLPRVVDRSEVNLEEIMAEARDILEEIYSERKVRIGLKFPEGMPPLRSDPSRLFDLLHTLLDFCMRCSHDSGVISAWVQHQKDKVRLRMRCPRSSIDPAQLMNLCDWPPPREEDEAAALGMRYRLAGHLLEELGGTLRMDTLGESGFSFLVILPVS